MNIHWKDIQDSDIVVEDKFGWTVRGRTVYWFGSGMRQAHAWLQRRAKADILREKNRRNNLEPCDCDAEPPLL